MKSFGLSEHVKAGLFCTSLRDSQALGGMFQGHHFTGCARDVCGVFGFCSAVCGV